LGKHRQAIQDFGTAIDINHNFTGAYFNRGVIYAKFGKKDLAIKDLVLAAKLGDVRAKNFLKNNGISW
jgi:tetratricopeptide (TPR) repeat protein